MQCVVPASPAIGTERYLRHLRCSILSVMSEDAAWCPAKDKYEKELQFDTDYTTPFSLDARLAVARDAVEMGADLNERKGRLLRPNW